MEQQLLASAEEIHTGRPELRTLDAWMEQQLRVWKGRMEQAATAHLRYQADLLRSHGSAAIEPPQHRMQLEYKPALGNSNSSSSEWHTL